MARALRPRKQRPSYASLIESDNENGLEADGSSSDEFQPPDEQEDPKDVEIDASDVEPLQEQENLAGQDESTSVIKTAGKRNLRKAKARNEAPASSRLPRTSTGPSSKPSRANNATPISNVDHRQRAEPLYLRPARVERLTEPPHPFKPSVTISTPSWNTNRSCAERYMKANGYNIGRGPIWELLEDRSWWKESLAVENGTTETEATRRPRVYESVKVNAALKILNEQEVHEYILPSNETSDEDSGETIKCFFGPPTENVRKEMKIFDNFDMYDEAADVKSHVFFAGGPVWGLDWCPVYAEDHPHRSYKQYVAVAPLPSKSHIPRIGNKCAMHACIQIWSYAPKFPQRTSTSKGKEKAAETNDDDFGRMSCALVLCIDCGPAHEIKWCPLPAHDSWEEAQPRNVRKLGLLAGAFEDGSLSVFVVPDPADLQPAAEGTPVFVKVEPIIRIEHEETCIWTLDWANSECMAVGCTNGSIAVYNIRDTLGQSTRDVLPTHYFSVHQSAIRSVRWIPVPSTSADGFLNFSQSPTMIASGGYDGCEIATDIRDGYGSILNRTRDVVLTVTYSRFTEGVVTIDLDHTVKTYAMAPGIFGRGNVVLEAGGPIWSLHTSDYHPFLALSSADGSVLITNMLRSTRRSAATPFLYYKTFQMDYSRKTGEYRMLDHFFPLEIPDRSSISLAKKGSKRAMESEHLRTGAQGTGVWSQEVSATRVSWNNGGGLSRAPLLASATASGLCRIDWLLGHFQDERVPYGGIEFIRNEVDSGIKVDEDEAD